VLAGREIGSAWVEGSVPKSVNGQNFPAVPVDVAREVGADWYSAAKDFVTFADGPRVNRLDVVRDLPVGDRVTSVLSTVGSFTAGGRATRAVYRDPTARGALTVWTRTKRAGSGRLYDKGGESGLSKAEGFARFEGQERVNSLRREGVETLRSLDQARADRLLADRWMWCGYGERVVPRETMVAQLMAAEGMRWDTKLKLAGWVAAGFPSLPNRQTEWRYRNRLRAFGQVTEDSTAWRLDLDRGLVAA
jgi:hypothetical protein